MQYGVDRKVRSVVICHRWLVLFSVQLPTGNLESLPPRSRSSHWLLRFILLLLCLFFSASISFSLPLSLSLSMAFPVWKINASKGTTSPRSSWNFISVFNDRPFPSAVGSSAFVISAFVSVIKSFRFISPDSRATCVQRCFVPFRVKCWFNRREEDDVSLWQYCHEWESTRY